MSILSDAEIAELCGWRLTADPVGTVTGDLILPNGNVPMIAPFEPYQTRVTNDVVGQPTRKIVSYGLSSYGYDVRLADEFKLFTNVNSAVVDPLDMDESCFHRISGDSVLIPPNSYLLGHTEETFHIPRDVQVICLGKSTYARCGAIVNCTPIEAGFRGQVVIEISNATPLPIRIYAHQGIAQFMFFRGSKPCMVSYADRGGKYQDQRGIQLAKV